jgi:hypothetical protein
MKDNKIIKYLAIICILGLANLTGCNEPIEDFGFDGQLRGKVVDANGDFISGDNKVATYAVHALGERDRVSMVMRIKPDGTYANAKLFPQSYKVWLIGPFIGARTDTVVIDLTGGKEILKDFQVIPLLNVAKPTINGNPTATQVKIDYNVAGNGGNTPNLREIYVSTVAWPTRTTGTGIGYASVNTTVTANQGTATISGLKPNTKYYVRVGARASGQSQFNHSDQISFTTPAN